MCVINNGFYGKLKNVRYFVSTDLVRYFSSTDFVRYLLSTDLVQVQWPTGRHSTNVDLTLILEKFEDTKRG